MAKKNIKDILEKVDGDNHSPEEELAAKLWLFQLNQNKELDLSDKKLDTISNKMWSAINKGKENQPTRLRTDQLWIRIAGMAAAIVFVLLGVYFFYENNEKDTSLLVQDVGPGKIGATLTLANGKKIRLSGVVKGELAKEAGVTIHKTADGQLVYEVSGSVSMANKINTLSTAKGETYQVRLPDGSLVYLNAASSLTYATSLIENGKRIVKLQGEGYFEIAKDKKHPFIVKTNQQEVEVLGTHFNVNCYSNEPETRTTLVEGSVKVSNGNSARLLKPDQQSISNGNTINVKNVNAEDEISWKDGVFLFQDETLASIMRRIARWYDVDVTFADGVDKNQLFGGGVSRYSNVSVVLEMLESTKSIHFKIEGRRILVMK
ncbi:transmembrane sensor [Pedobacter africanus]|uniref:Ferric-dicitrate binding protein FerR (Iron transport regulator) n=1 Tax=Pedobacter africanus TaxID=151894 RepID=A0ACC6L1Z7_9SPHI|nr:FecR domain-containing protein [Pedobacter africanus]MDR6785532.1 ferric-dicitrate binding protein FerR (iron transport regulator) [Pedobacter africanus]